MHMPKILCTDKGSCIDLQCIILLGVLDFSLNFYSYFHSHLLPRQFLNTSHFESTLKSECAIQQQKIVRDGEQSQRNLG